MTKLKSLLPPRYTSLLNEAKGDGADCILVPVNIPFWTKITDNIRKADIWDKEKGHGIEEEPHVTILYGIVPGTLTNQSIRDNVVDFFTGFAGIKLESDGISLFENDKFDVLKFNIKLTNNLQYVRRYAETLPFESKYPIYEPHCTIAYLKKGKGKEYVKELTGKYEFIYLAQSVIYSEANGNKYQIQMGCK